MITILTHSPFIFSKENIKSKLKKILRKKRGPTGVIKSIENGLKSYNYEFRIDPPAELIGNVVHVVSGIEALRKILALKKQGVVKKIIAGPNLVITPKDENGIIMDSLIDVILLPSEWTKKFYDSFDEELSKKTIIWPAGVEIPLANTSEKKFDFLIYKKNIPEQIFKNIIKLISNKKLNYKIIYYGKFNQQNYFNLLNQSRYMIYLQEVESQGLSLQEAWARNVPTLVWNKDEYIFKKTKIIKVTGE